MSKKEQNKEQQKDVAEVKAETAETTQPAEQAEVKSCDKAECKDEIKGENTTDDCVKDKEAHYETKPADEVKADEKLAGDCGCDKAENTEKAECNGEAKTETEATVEPQTTPCSCTTASAETIVNGSSGTVEQCLAKKVRAACGLQDSKIFSTENVTLMAICAVLAILFMWTLFTKIGHIFVSEGAGNIIQTEMMLPKSKTRLDRLNSLVDNCPKWDKSLTSGDKYLMKQAFNDVKDEVGRNYDFTGAAIERGVSCMDKNVSIIPVFDSDKNMHQTPDHAQGFILAENTADGWNVLLNYIPYKDHPLKTAGEINYNYGKLPYQLHQIMFGNQFKNLVELRKYTNDVGDYIRVEKRNRY